MSITERARGKEKKEIGMNYCRKCGECIGKIKIGKNLDLRCGNCRKELDYDLRQGLLKDFDYYFTYYQRTRGQTTTEKSMN